MTYVATKRDLKKALKRKDPEIVVNGKLAKQLKPLLKLKNLSKKERAALLVLLSGTGAAAATAIAASVPTGGLSVVGATAFLVAAAPAAGVSVETIVIAITLLGAIGLSIIALLKDYDFEVKAGNQFYFKAKKQPDETL